MTLSPDLIDTVVRPVSWALIHFLWQGSLVAGALALVLYLLRGHSAAVRYGWAVGALVIALIMPAVTTFHYLNVEQPGEWSEAAAPWETPAPLVAAPGTADIATAQPETRASSFHTSLSVERLFPFVFAFWLAGVMLLSCVHLMGWRRVRYLTRQRVRPVAQIWQQRVQSLSRQLGIPRVVTMLESTLVLVPTVVGWLRPVILMPASTLSGLPAALIESVIAHELAHVLRRDHLVNLLQIAAETWLFYHPAIWWISRQIRIEREDCCDDIAAAVCGDRVAYAQALLHFEESRGRVPALALRASDGSLLRRIKRLIGGTTMTKRSTHGSRFALATLAVLFIAGGAILAIAAEWSFTDPAPDAPKKQPSFQVAQAAEESPRSRSRESDTRAEHQDQADIHGKWEAELENGKVKLNLRTSGEWKSQFTVRTDQSEFTGLTFGEEVSFTLNREAGVFSFSGDLSGSASSGSGEGTFTFVPDPGFPGKMKRLGVTDLDDEMIFVLAATDVGTAYVEGLQERGYKKVSGEELVALAIHQVDLEYIDTMAELGYGDESLEQLLAMRIHGVSKEYIEEMDALGYHAESTENLLAWRIHGVDAEYVEELAELGFKDLDAEHLVAWRIHGVDADFIESMQEIGFTDLDAEELVALRIHHVTPAHVKEMRSHGFTDLDAEQAMAFQIHGVNPEFIAEMSKLGYDDLSGEQLLAMRIHHVTPDFIEDLAELGYTKVPAEKLVAMRIHHVTIRYIEKLHEKGRTDLDIDDMIRMKIHHEEI